VEKIKLPSTRGRRLFFSDGLYIAPFLVMAPMLPWGHLGLTPGGRLESNE